MFGTSKKDLKFWQSDNSDITHDPHPQSSTCPVNRIHYLTHRAVLHGLAGSNITIAGQKFQAALQRRIDAVPVQDEWIEMDDLFGFLLPLISNSTIETICGTNFLKVFPDFVEYFWSYNSKMPKLLQGWPRWTMPKIWQARDRCISIMKEWRRISNNENFDGNAMYQRRWDFFSKIQGLSDDGAASSDLGILWAYVTLYIHHPNVMLTIMSAG